MISLQIADVKVFMNKLLLNTAFDSFLLLEASITTFNTFHIDGTLQKDYFTQEEKELLDDRNLSKWSEIRPFCLELIKGKKTPLSFKLTFQLSSSNTEKLLLQTGIKIPPEQIRGLLLNIRFTGKKLFCTTGTSLAVFTMDKSMDHAWDDMVQRFFHQQEIPYELE